MTSGEHWPFTHGTDSAEEREIDRAREHQAEKELSRTVASASRAAHARMNRLLVGGRAHVRKHGLS
jgi:hypothetical protein